MDVMQAIRTKRAVRQFRDSPLPREVVETILNAGRRAQSSKNTQPWHFIAVEERAVLNQLSMMGNSAEHLAGAALGIVILTPDPASRFSVMFDAGQSAAYMQLAAWDSGIGSCLATIYEPEKARDLLGFPDAYHVRIAISFGVPSDPGLLTASPRKGGRLEFDEIVHWNRW